MHTTTADLVHISRKAGAVPIGHVPVSRGLRGAALGALLADRHWIRTPVTIRQLEKRRPQRRALDKYIDGEIVSPAVSFVSPGASTAQPGAVGRHLPSVPPPNGPPGSLNPCSAVEALNDLELLRASGPARCPIKDGFSTSCARDVEPQGGRSPVERAGPPWGIEEDPAPAVPLSFIHQETSVGDHTGQRLTETVLDRAREALRWSILREADVSAEASYKVDTARRDIAGRLVLSDSAWLRKRGERMAECADRYLVAKPRQKPDESKPVAVNHCKDRLCPVCARIRAHKWAERVAPMLEEVRAGGRSSKMLTLTQVTKPGESLGSARRRFERAFRRLYIDRRWRERVDGWLCSREVKWSEGAWHYHAHVLVDCEYWEQKQIAALWLEVTGDSSIVDIRAARVNSEREIVKYATKVLSVPANRPELLEELATALFRVRTVSSGGKWRGRVRDADIEPTDEPPAGVEFVSIGQLLEDMRAGNEDAAVALFACVRWVEERSGRAGHKRLTAALAGRFPIRIRGADGLEKKTAGVLESRGGGWLREANASC